MIKNMTIKKISIGTILLILCFLFVLFPKNDNTIKLKGETIEYSDEAVRKGWVLVAVDGFPLGFGKADDRGSIKNKYLPGWRIMS